VRIVRFVTDDDPKYGALLGDIDEYGQPEDDAPILELAGDPLYVGIQPTEKQHVYREVRLLAPVIPRSKVVAIGKNYAAHAAEFDGIVPEEPLMFLKPNTSVIGPDDLIRYPAISSNVHYEGELAVVIGRICRDVPAEQAAEVIFGYTVANDVTARDLQRKDVQFTRGKGFDTFCPLGPWIETEWTLDQVKAGVRVTTHLNGELKQDSTTDLMVFDIPRLIAAITEVMTLLPGDVILTGTPEGVGAMEVGDEVEVSIEGLGALTNKVAARE
jgi:2-keto-4-pentenoate hydratase/2-oxohepta-3-ene-1,7-dioic acid hydratase in catechol pathway